MINDQKTLSKGQKAFKITLISLILVNLIFIFTQSLLPPEIASAESEAVSDVITDILPPDSSAVNFTDDNMDKIAHLIEFGVLGALTSLYVCFFIVTVKKFFLPLLGFVGATALFDETIQIFSGRTFDLADIMFDVLGFSVLSVVVFTTYSCLRRHSLKGKINGQNN